MRIHILTIIILSTFLASITSAAEREWTTQEKLSNGETIIFYWVGVYEGLNTVYKITKGKKTLELGKLNAAGQPTINLKHNILALPYCADDGCLETINIVELNNLKLMHPIELRYKGQFYIQCKWINNILELQVEHEPWGKPKKSITIHKYDVLTKKLIGEKG